MDDENSLLLERLYGIFLLTPGIFIDFDRCSISVCETEYPLTAREVELLILLVKYPHRYHRTCDSQGKLQKPQQIMQLVNTVLNKQSVACVAN